MDKSNLTDYERGLCAELEGKITVAWYKLCKECGLELGENDEDNLYFMVFQAGACLGGSINNKMWMSRLDQFIQTTIGLGLHEELNQSDREIDDE
uniref:Uncharacterized protein n=1 Tax=viral metagenome TaxID=1070528 RepID=A0A6M3LR57_9ZZZZ